MEKNNGWIWLHRKIRDNWIWDDPVKLKWWLDILLQVNHNKKIVKVNIGLHIIDCGRGQSVMSLQNWAERWNVSKSCARHFLTLLQCDGMIKIENVIKSTRITVCNFDSYNKPTHDRETHEKRTRNDRETRGDPNNNGNNGNNDQEYIMFYESELSKTENQDYHSLVKWLLGENENNEPFTQCLSLKNQIGYKQFLNLKSISEEYGTKIQDKIRTLENKFSKYKPTSLNMTLVVWLKNKFEK